MRTTKELLILIRDYITIPGHSFYGGDTFDVNGICGVINMLYYTHCIKHKEYRLVHGYLENNKPAKNENFPWWFAPYEKSGRIAWLNEEINKL